MSKIPVFVSCPTSLNEKQNEYNEMINKLLDANGLERRALGRSDYPLENPLKEVVALAKHCAGGLILGFEQMYAENVTQKRGTSAQKNSSSMLFPTPWNNLEAGVLYSLDLPLLILKEGEISGGIFDVGTSSYYIHNIESNFNLQQVFFKWVMNVHKKYYE